MKQFIKEMPKLELHCHLDGSVRIETMYEILLKQGYIEDIGLDKFKESVLVKEDNESLIEYLEKFDYPIKVMQEEENITRIVYELLEDASKENIIYLEIRFAPYLHMEKGLSFNEVLNAAIEGLNKGMKDFKIKANLILIGMRHENSESILKIVEEGKYFLNKGVVGIDLAGNESDFPPEIHKKVILRAKELGYKVTLHAGETGNFENIITSINMGADRIGHGIAAKNDKETMELIINNNIGLEICPTSNIQTKAVRNLEEYPIREFIDKGIKISINTDNRTVSNTNLCEEYSLLINNFNLTRDEVLLTVENAIITSFSTLEDKEYMHRLLNNFKKSY